jgi:hypothetical protein
MLTTRQVAQVLNKGEWTASLDLTDAYLHVPIRRVLPFGRKIDVLAAPYVFTRVASQLSKFVQKFAIWLLQYLDV